MWTPKSPRAGPASRVSYTSVPIVYKYPIYSTKFKKFEKLHVELTPCHPMIILIHDLTPTLDIPHVPAIIVFDELFLSALHQTEQTGVSFQRDSLKDARSTVSHLLISWIYFLFLDVSSATQASSITETRVACQWLVKSPRVSLCSSIKYALTAYDWGVGC